MDAKRQGLILINVPYVISFLSDKPNLFASDFILDDKGHPESDLPTF